MNVACANYTFDSSITSSEVLVERYETLTSWALALQSAGATVSVVQRFGSNTELTHLGIPFRFVLDPSLKDGSPLDKAKRMNAAIAAARPDIVHVNGLQFARQARNLKRLLSDVPILLQDHAAAPPRNRLNRWTLGRALRRMDGVSFVSREQARPWIDARLLKPDQPVFELMEGSSNFSLKPQAEARAQTGLAGAPLCLWVGRLDTNKDPMSVLKGFAKVLPLMPNARLAMVYSATGLLPTLKEWLAQNPAIASRVTLIGQRPHAELEDIYNSADLFLLGSHHEGSGYAVLEALACGVAPIVTDIPSFRVLTGDGTVGGLWPCGDSEALAATLISRHSLSNPGTRQEVRAFFDKHFRWDAIGQQAVAAYRSLM